MRGTRLALLALLMPLTGAAAEPAAAPRRPAPSRSESVPGGEGWSVELSHWTVFDSNIDHELLATRDVGMVFGIGLGWKGRTRRSRIELDYGLAGHRYRTTDAWNRVSHHVLASFQPRGVRWLGLETVGEVSLKGSTEDRELGNQYQLVQRLEPRLARGTSIRLDGALRLKRYAEDGQRNATNRYLEAELRQRLGGARLDLGSRREINDAVGARNRYTRWIHQAALRLSMGGGDELELAMKVKSQRYPERLVKVNGVSVPRQDQRLVPSLSWAFGLTDRLGLRLEYKFERRTSNDPGKEFAAHLVALGFTCRW